MSKKTLEQALEAFTIVRFCVPPAQRPTIERAITAVIEALAKQEHGEPVAWELGAEVYWGDSPEMSDYVRKEGTPLYTTPQQRKPLTDELIAYGKTASEMMASDQTRFDAACEVLRYLKQERVPYYYLHRMLTVIHGNEEAAHGIKE